LLSEVASYVDAGYRRIKLKIEPGWDLEPVRAVREAWPDMPLQTDANQAYTRADTSLLGAMDPLGLLLVEQPLPEDDLRGHALLAEQISTPVCLDESIISTAVADTAIAFGATSVINIKPGRVGGYLEAKAIHDLCVQCDIPVWCGGMLETGIGRAANVALAALPGFTLPGDTSASKHGSLALLTTSCRMDGCACRRVRASASIRSRRCSMSSVPGRRSWTAGNCLASGVGLISNACGTQSSNRDATNLAGDAINRCQRASRHAQGLNEVFILALRHPDRQGLGDGPPQHRDGVGCGHGFQPDAFARGVPGRRLQGGDRGANESGCRITSRHRGRCWRGRCTTSGGTGGQSVAVLALWHGV
ncbi:MAG: enolase C-terminal domain-like protein, partial [Candidatus Nanopelagicales bacterium]